MKGLGFLDARPLPDFQRWLDEHGHSGRAPDFEAFMDLAKRTQTQTADHLDEDSKSFLRLWQGLSLAVVELCNVEHERGRDPAQIVQMLPRALACAAFYSTASILKDDAPWRSITRILNEEFRFGTKACADRMTDAAESGNQS